MIYSRREDERKEVIKMKIGQNELRAIEDMLANYREQHGDVAIKHEATNCSNGSCYGSCFGGCGGGCQGRCSAFAR